MSIPAMLTTTLASMLLPPPPPPPASPIASARCNLHVATHHSACSVSGNRNLLAYVRVLKFRSQADNQQPDTWMQAFLLPQHWTTPSAAAQEAEWLKSNLHAWLDDEYCPEAANEEISERCAKVYYQCLLDNQLDIGDVLIQMTNNLERFSFKESFHGPFSSANAAVDLIMQRVTSLEETS